MEDEKGKLTFPGCSKGLDNQNNSKNEISV